MEGREETERIDVRIGIERASRHQHVGRRERKARGKDMEGMSNMGKSIIQYMIQDT